MKHRQLLFRTAPALLLLHACGSPPGTGQEQRKPNIVIILADDLGWADVGYNGNNYFQTPHMDRLAAEGIVLSRFYPSAANCAPSRASLLTGMYSPRHGVYLPQGLSRGGDVPAMRWKVPTHGQDSSWNTFPVSINNVDPGFESLAEMLKRGGYITARLGKWHIGDDNQGFDLSSADGSPGLVTNTGGEEERFYNDTTVAERLTGAAVEFIETHSDKPFFLYLSHWEVHSPMAARKERVEYFTRKMQSSNLTDASPVYAAEVEQIDISVGRIMETLRKCGIEDNTLLIFTSDNGGSLSQTTNRPLRAGKGTFYEGGIRVPFVARWPGYIPAGTSSGFPVNGIDFMPTFAEMAGVSLPAAQPVDGMSVLPVLRGEKPDKERTMFFHFPLYLGGEGPASRVLPAYDGRGGTWRAVPSTTMIKGNWKLIWYYEYDSHELFDLSADPGEENNLAGKLPDTEKLLLEELHRWVDEVKAPVPSILNK